MNRSNYNYTVVLCTYNGEQYISLLLESIINQTIAPKEIIISDDGSDDRTLSIIREFENSVTDIIFTYLMGPRRGPSENFIKSLSIANSDWVFIADQDDIWVSDKVEVYFSEVELSSVPCLVFSDSTLIDHKGEIIAFSHLNSIGIYSGYIDNRIYFRNPVQGATMLLNRPMLEMILDYSSKISISDVAMYDWWIAILSKHFGEIVFIERPMLLYRVHSQNAIGIRKLPMCARIKNFKKILNQVCFSLKLYNKWNWLDIQKELRLSFSQIRKVGFIRYYMVYFSIKIILIYEFILKAIRLIF
ncbi:glycosyltransferase family 2 protein [Vibrio cholerae]|uniref:glycosyltransferase family 2 protein n=1 Tax=Vibrio cholerae TaxID=666 RepID=UPI0016522945|nr:glycosyltransferase family 2 protein [Vibrio cholerae]EKF6289098.1 glycosyltransferase family 2 protein [Vibrio cholerae]BCN20612.1 putative glycosyltransferase [Vibrio cholerae]GIB58889.1 alpha-L-Rha alpha-1,3-L-rhamnosyltransferase [Vibrio cholerae]HAS3582873.1 glycosyltransferase family 2 protein [Vibrio cholerae]